MAIRLTESRLRQIIREEAAKLTRSRRSTRRLSEMADDTMAPAAPGSMVVAAIYAGPDGAELELNDADDGSDEAFQVREDFEMDSADAEGPGGFGSALRKSASRLAKLGVTHISFSVGDSEQTPVPLADAPKILTALVRKAQRASYY